MMRIAYLTADEVNACRVRRLARACGMQMRVLAPKDALGNGCGDLVLCDLDSVSPGRPHALLARLIASPVFGQIAIHSYHLSTAEKARLRKQGVLIFRRLARPALRRIRQALIGRQGSECRDTAGDLSAARSRTSDSAELSS
jgi:hypothetical protein